MPAAKEMRATAHAYRALAAEFMAARGYSADDWPQLVEPDEKEVVRVSPHRMLFGAPALSVVAMARVVEAADVVLYWLRAGRAVNWAAAAGALVALGIRVQDARLACDEQGFLGVLAGSLDAREEVRMRTLIRGQRLKARATKDANDKQTRGEGRRDELAKRHGERNKKLREVARAEEARREREESNNILSIVDFVEKEAMAANWWSCTAINTRQIRNVIFSKER